MAAVALVGTGDRRAAGWTVRPGGRIFDLRCCSSASS